MSAVTNPLVAHLTRLQAQRPHYRHQVPIELNGVCANAMVDSGNLWRNVISPNLLDRLGLGPEDLRPVPGSTTISTAKAGSALRVLGETKRPLKLRLGAHGTQFITRPVVLDGLAMDFNLAGPFLQKHNIDQLHSRNCLRVQGKLIPLVAGLTGQEATSGGAYLAEDVTLAPMSVNMVRLRVPEVIGRRMSAGDGILQGSIALMTKHEVNPWIAAMVHCPEDGRMIAGLVNLNEDAVRLPAGTRYGTFEKEDPIEP